LIACQNSYYCHSSSTSSISSSGEGFCCFGPGGRSPGACAYYVDSTICDGKLDKFFAISGGNESSAWTACKASTYCKDSTTSARSSAYSASSTSSHSSSKVSSASSSSLTGACCDIVYSYCMGEQITSAQCKPYNQYGIAHFYQGMSCAQVNCSTKPPASSSSSLTGACCDATYHYCMGQNIADTNCHAYRTGDSMSFTIGKTCSQAGCPTMAPSLAN
jgi:hypothetical protein